MNDFFKIYGVVYVYVWFIYNVTICENYTASNSRMIQKWRIWKNLERTYTDLNDVLT